MKKIVSVFLLSLLIPASGAAAVRLASVFGDRMVLQRNVRVPVWGTGQKGEKITVMIAGQTKAAVADDAGKWMVHLDPMKEGGPHVLAAAGRDTVRIADILVGEVWLCSGQSNMALAVEKAANAEKEIASADYPAIRLFTVKRTVADTPEQSCSGEWLVCDSSSVRSFSAAAYFFGRTLHRDLRVPVGLVHSAYGGTPAEAWMSAHALDADTAFGSIRERWKENLLDYPAKKKQFDAVRDSLTKQWNEASERAVREGKAAPARPQEPLGPGNRSTPSGLYNGMIAPIVPFAFKGVIWYQGEANAGRALQYRRLFPALIRDWRTQWNEDLPFYYVQLPNLDRQPEPSKSGWAELREAQLMTLALPGTAMAVTIDIGDPTNLHPQNKQDVGVRLALLAEGLLYGIAKKECQSPIYRSSAIEGSRVRIRFANAAGLHARETKDAKNGTTMSGASPAVTGFAIAGADKVFVPAQAAIDGGDAIVWSDEVKTPVSVRYAWADNPSCNLVNESGLPASPFRTDEWTSVTLKQTSGAAGTRATANTPEASAAGLRTFIRDPRELERVRASMRSGSNDYQAIVKALRREAEKALTVRPVSVMQKEMVPPSGSKHDYMSMGKYWWPDPAKKDGLPYIRRDGEINPESKKLPDHDLLAAMIKTVSTLSYASYYLGGEQYADRAALLVRTWFLDTSTRMNPNLAYAQAVPGIDEVRGYGIIDAHALCELIDALGLLAESPSFTPADRSGVKRWFTEYLRWLRESRDGMKEAGAPNNHGTWYDVQVASIAMYVGDAGLARAVLADSRLRRIASQIEPDGTQPRELARTRSLGYTLMNLKAFTTLALLGERAGVDLWHYETTDGRSIRKAFDYMLPYIRGEKKWERQQIGEAKWSDLYLPLLDASRAFNDPVYTEAASKLPDAAKLSQYSRLFTTIHP